MSTKTYEGDYRSPSQVDADDQWFDEVDRLWRDSHADPSGFRVLIENEMAAEAIAWARYYRANGDNNAAAGLSAFAARHGFDEYRDDHRAAIEALMGLPRKPGHFP